MKVLSLFDGMSCGQIALRELGANVTRYYASEIDRHAIAQTKLNFPNTIHLGNVERWREWDIDWASVDLIIGGSPCQGFSFAGKQLAFDDPRSRLFFVYADILDHTRKRNPEVKFLLENVVMKQEHINVITECLGVHPVMINSALVSAQNRKRLYWSNIRTRVEGLFGEVYTDIPQPKDRGIVIRDILEDEVDEKYYQSKASCLTAGGHSGGNHSDMDLYYIQQRPRGENKGGVFTEKSPTLTSCSYEQNNVVVQLNPSKESGGTQPYQGNRIYADYGKHPTLMTEVRGGVFRTYKDGRGFKAFAGDKFGTLTARAREDGSGQLCASLQNRIRRLTPTECARLQTIPEWYKWACSDAQAYKMLGNGWTVEVIKHIFSFL